MILSSCQIVYTVAAPIKKDSKLIQLQACACFSVCSDTCSDKCFNQTNSLGRLAVREPEYQAPKLHCGPRLWGHPRFCASAMPNAHLSPYPPLEDSSRIFKVIPGALHLLRVYWGARLPNSKQPNSLMIKSSRWLVVFS